MTMSKLKDAQARKVYCGRRIRCLPLPLDFQARPLSPGEDGKKERKNIPIDNKPNKVCASNSAGSRTELVIVDNQNLPPR